MRYAVITIKTLRGILAGIALSTAVAVLYESRDVIQDLFADSSSYDSRVAVEDAYIDCSISQQDTSLDTSLPSLDDAVYDYLTRIGTDKNGFPTPLKTWRKTIDEIGQENLRDYVDIVVALTSDACAKYSFPSNVECVPLMLALFMQESQLYLYATNPYAAGIAQLGVEAAIEQELQLPQGPKYVAWMKARETKGYSDDNRTRRAYSRAISEIARTKHQQAREYELPAFDERYDVECAIPAATAVMYKLLKAQDGNIIRALHAYNFGSANLKKAEDSDTELPDETQRHAEKISRLYEMLRVSAF
jgi:hypothetical protein